MTAPVAAAPLDIADAIADAVASAMPVPQPEGEDVAAPDPDTPEAADDAAPEADVVDAAAPAPDAGEPSGDDAGAEAPSDAPVELPDGYVAVPTVAEGLATEFKLLDGEGEVEVPALMVEYKANGKVRQDRLDQVVKLAQWGVYNQEREQKLQQETQGKVEEALQALKEREAQMERLLTDEDFLYAVREAYAAENTPEKRVERVEAEKAAMRVEYELQSISQAGEQFYQAEVAPALQLIQQALPTLSAEELESKLQMALQAHVEVAPNGVAYVPPSRYDAIRQYIVEDLALWAQAAHTRRHQPVAQRSAEQAKAAAELERAQVEAQKAKRMVGQKLKPVGQPGATADRPAKAKTIVSVDDAVESALSSVLSSIR